MVPVKEKINQFYNDVFDDKRKTLILPSTRIFFHVRKDGQYSGSFVIKSGDSRNVRGMIYTSDYRMRLRETGFDSRQTKISFTYDASGLTPGEMQKGKFIIVSEAGEYEIIFTAMIEIPYIETSMGKITNLEEFTKLANYNYNEAASLFASIKFREVIENEKEEVQSYYEALRKIQLNRNSLEEFLIGTGMKEKIRIKVADKERLYENVGRTHTDYIEISKNTWGFIPIRVETEGDFISVDLDEFTSMEFKSNRYELEYKILIGKLHRGRNFGCIRIINPYGTDVVRVEAFSEITDEDTLKASKEIQKKKLDLIRYYIDYKFKNLGLNVWASKSKDILSILDGGDEEDTDSIYPLIRAYILLEEKKTDEARVVLEPYDKKRWSRNTNVENNAFYLFLSSKVKRELSYSLRVVDELQRLYDRNEDNWGVLWSLLQVKENLIQNGDRRLQVLSNQWDSRKFHSILYVESYLALIDQPGLIDLGDAFIVRVLLFAMKRDILTREIASSIALAVTRQHSFNKFIFSILKRCYELFPSKEILSAVCRYLILGEKTDREYFIWYERGINEGIHLAKLYEYYLYSAGDDRLTVLPEAIFLYFSHQTELSAEKKIFLYSNLVRHQAEYPEIYDNNYERMKEFTRQQLIAGKISDNLRVLYRHFLPVFEHTPEISDSVAKIVYTYELRVDRPDIRYAVVIHNGLSKAVTVPVIGGTAMVQVYTADDRILLRDNRGYTYSNTINFELNRLFPEDKYIRDLRREGCDNIGILLSTCESRIIDRDNEKYYEMLVTNEQVREKLKRDTKCSLLFYHFEQDNTSKVKQYLSEVDELWLDAQERSKLIGIYLRQNQIKKAYDVIRNFGFEEVELKYLTELCSRFIKEEYYHENRLLLAACYSCFCRNCCEDSMLSFLVDFFIGKTSDMMNVWKVANERGFKVARLEERILTQMLFSEELVNEEELFYHYYVNGSNERIRKAYLAYRCYGYFVKNQILPENFFEYIETEFAHSERINTICKLAALRYYSVEEANDQLIRRMLNEFLDDSISQGFMFSYFTKTGAEVLKKYLMNNRVMVQYQSTRRGKVTIYYMICNENTHTENYKSEIMREIYKTYFLKEFVLFSGEVLKYFIIEETDKGSSVVEIGVIDEKDIRHDDHGRLSEINNMLEDERPEHLLEDYERRNYLTGQLFQIL